MTGTVRATVVTAVAIASFLVAACAVAAALVAGRAAPHAPVDLHIENGTSQAITILVNGSDVVTVPAARATAIPAAVLPVGDWLVEARLAGGRTVLQGPIAPSAVCSTTGLDGASEQSGSGQRVDLSCGRLDIWVGVPMLGPVPGPGTPGDCDG